MLPFHSFNDFLQMGGYARFVWPAYGVVCLVLGANVVTAVLQFRRTQKPNNKQQDRGD